MSNAGIRQDDNLGDHDQKGNDDVVTADLIAEFMAERRNHTILSLKSTILTILKTLITLQNKNIVARRQRQMMEG